MICLEDAVRYSVLYWTVLHLYGTVQYIMCIIAIPNVHMYMYNVTVQCSVYPAVLMYSTLCCTVASFS